MRGWNGERGLATGKSLQSGEFSLADGFALRVPLGILGRADKASRVDGVNATMNDCAAIVAAEGRVRKLSACRANCVAVTSLGTDGENLFGSRGSFHR